MKPVDKNVVQPIRKVRDALRYQGSNPSPNDTPRTLALTILLPRDVLVTLSIPQPEPCP